MIRILEIDWEALTIESLNNSINDALAWIPIYLRIRNFLVVYLVKEEQAIVSDLIILCLTPSLRLLFSNRRASGASIILKSGGNGIFSSAIILFDPAVLVS